MSPNQLVFHDAASDKILRAVEILAAAVINTIHKERELAHSDYDREKLVESSCPSLGYNAASRICFKLLLKAPHTNNLHVDQRCPPHPLLSRSEEKALKRCDAIDLTHFSGPEM